MKSLLRTITMSLLAALTFVLPMQPASAHYMSGWDKDHNWDNTSFEHNFKQFFSQWGDHDSNYFQSQTEKELNSSDSQIGWDGEDGFDGNDGFVDGNDGYDKTSHYDGACDDGQCDHNVPEPSPLVLLGLGVMAIGIVRKFVPSLRK